MSVSKFPDEYVRTGITFTNGPSINTHDVLQITAVFENMSLEPTDIQVWQFPVGWKKNCPTDKPIAFISPDRSSVEQYKWLMCVDPNVRYAQSTVLVPWVEVDSWTYSKRPKGTSVLEEHKPTYWDWHVQADLGYYEVYRNEVTDPIGYLVIIYSGDTLLAREWVD